MKNEKGQSLIEAMIALGAAALIVSAMVVAVVTAVNNADYSKNENLATISAQQGIEVLRELSESNWNSFSSASKLGTSLCLNANSTVLNASSGCTHLSKTDTSVNVPPYFVRQVDLVKNDLSCPDPNSIHGTVNVYWADGKCSNSNNYYCHVVTLDSCFTNINSAPAL